MDEKKGTLPRPVTAPSHRSLSSRAPRRSRFIALFLACMFLLWNFQPAIYHSGVKPLTGKLRFAACRMNTPGEQRVCMHSDPPFDPEDCYIVDPCTGKNELEEQATEEVAKEVAIYKPSGSMSAVPLEAHIMSKCPDAQDCLVDLIVPSMQRIADKVNWTLSFIGEVDEDDSLHCKHGETECLGNMLMLCAAKLYPDPKISLGFSTCMIKEYRDIPSRQLTEACALEHAVDFEALNDCVSEEGEGLDLLKSSFQRSKDFRVERSCTVRLNGKIRCIRDGGEWVNCDDGSDPGDLIRDINALYQQ